MIQHDYILILRDTLKDLDESRRWLKRAVSSSVYPL
jgi:hypothetical protein